MPFGLIDTSFIDFPSSVDAAYLRGLQTRSGLNFTDLASRVDAGMAQVNGGADPVMASLLAPPTTTEFARGGRSGQMVVQKKSQYTPARPQLAERTAHMLAIDELDIALGFTEDGLQEIGIDDFQVQVDAMVSALERAARVDTFVRLFSDAEVPVDGSTSVTATSPGFAGSGTGGNAFSGLYPDGTALPGGYTHYYRDTAANRALVLEAAQSRLLKWGGGFVDLIGSEAAIAAVMALPKFIASGSALVRPAQGTAEALVDTGEFVGVYNGTVRVRLPITDYADDTYAMVRSFGAFNPRNPLVWRFDPLRGRDAYVRSREMFPLAQANAMWKYGVNVNDRTGAALIKIAAAGVYTSPAFTY